MPLKIIEGAWEDIAPQIDLHGRRVRVLIDDLEPAQEVVIRELPTDPAAIKSLAARNPWLRSLHAWAESHAPLPHPVDDSRDSIYEDLIRDPR